jgi:hypothetical protein
MLPGGVRRRGGGMGVARTGLIVLTVISLLVMGLVAVAFAL